MVDAFLQETITSLEIAI